MKIGIDIDGTITTPFYWLDFYNKKLDKNLKPKDISSYEHQLVFNMSLNSFNTFRDKYINEIHLLATPRNNAAYYVNQLYFRYKEIHYHCKRKKTRSTY